MKCLFCSFKGGQNGEQSSCNNYLDHLFYFPCTMNVPNCRPKRKRIASLLHQSLHSCKLVKCHQFHPRSRLLVCPFLQHRRGFLGTHLPLFTAPQGLSRNAPASFLLFLFLLLGRRSDFSFFSLPSSACLCVCLLHTGVCAFFRTSVRVTLSCWQFYVRLKCRTTTYIFLSSLPPKELPQQNIKIPPD